MAKLTSYSTAQLKKMLNTRSGEELLEIKAILTKRGINFDPETGEEVCYVAEAPETEAPETEAPETEAPETEAPETEASKQKDPKPLKKQLSDSEAQDLLKTALTNKGKECEFLCTKTKETTKGVIRTARIDKRNNFIQYRITTDLGEFGKGIDSLDLKIF